MNKHLVPPAPQPSFHSIGMDRHPGNSPRHVTQRAATRRASFASTQLAPLDAAFLSRTYITTLWFGTVLTLCAAAITQSFVATLSFAGGAALGALLLKSQEIFVRRVIRPQTASLYQGWDARIPVVALLAGKYIVIGAALSTLINHHLLHPAAFALGFMTEQVVIVSKVLGRMAAQRIRPVSEVCGEVRSEIRGGAVGVVYERQVSSNVR